MFMTKLNSVSFVALITFLSLSENVLSMDIDREWCPYGPHGNSHNVVRVVRPEVQVWRPQFLNRSDLGPLTRCRLGLLQADSAVAPKIVSHAMESPSLEEQILFNQISFPAMHELEEKISVTESVLERLLILEDQGLEVDQDLEYSFLASLRDICLSPFAIGTCKKWELTEPDLLYKRLLSKKLRDFFVKVNRVDDNLIRNIYKAAIKGLKSEIIALEEVEQPKAKKPAVDPSDKGKEELDAPVQNEDMDIEMATVEVIPEVEMATDALDSQKAESDQPARLIPVPLPTPLAVAEVKPESRIPSGANRSQLEAEINFLRSNADKFVLENKFGEAYEVFKRLIEIGVGDLEDLNHMCMCHVNMAKKLYDERKNAEARPLLEESRGELLTYILRINEIDYSGREADQAQRLESADKQLQLVDKWLDEINGQDKASSQMNEKEIKDTLILNANKLYKQDNYADALEIYKEIRAMGFGDFDLLRKMVGCQVHVGRKLFESKRYSEAFPLLTEAKKEIEETILPGLAAHETRHLQAQTFIWNQEKRTVDNLLNKISEMK